MIKVVRSSIYFLLSNGRVTILNGFYPNELRVSKLLKSKMLAFFIGLIAIQNLLAHQVYAQGQQRVLPPPTKSIDLANLIRLYMLPAGKFESSMLDWSTGSTQGTPIIWEHAGVKDCDPYHDKEFDAANCRTGHVVVTVNGKPTHTVLGKTVQPGRWKILLMGPRPGASDVEFDSDAISQDLGSGLLQATTAQQGSSLKLTSIKQCGSSSDGSNLFLVNSPQRQPAYVKETISCGTAGCSVNFLLAFEQDEARRLMDSACH